MTKFNSTSESDFLEILFEDKNKAYGAYQLRRSYPFHLRNAMMLGLLFFSALIGIPILAKYMLFPSNDPEPTHIQVELIRTRPQPEKPLESEKPESKPRQKVQNTTKTQRLTPPRIVNDALVNETDIPTVEDISVNTAAVNNQTGSSVYIPQVEEPIIISTPIEENIEQIFNVVEQDPAFPGGTAALMEYLAMHIKYPNFAASNGIEGRVTLSFVINTLGQIQNVKILRGIGAGCDEEAIRVVREMPNWKPGKQNGKTVSVLFSLPINFKLK